MFRGSLVVTVNTRAVVHVHDMGRGRPLASVTLDEGLTIQSGTPGPSLVEDLLSLATDISAGTRQGPADRLRRPGQSAEGYEHPDAGPEVLARLFEHLASRIREETAMWSAGQPSPDDDPPDQESPGQ